MQHPLPQSNERTPFRYATLDPFLGFAFLVCGGFRIIRIELLLHEMLARELIDETADLAPTDAPMQALIDLIRYGRW